MKFTTQLTQKIAEHGTACARASVDNPLNKSRDKHPNKLGCKCEQLSFFAHRQKACTFRPRQTQAFSTRLPRVQLTDTQAKNALIPAFWSHMFTSL